MKINSQNIFTFIITFIPSQRYVSYIFFFLIILQKMIVWEEKHPLKKKKLYSSAKANFYPSVNCSTCFLKKYFSRCITIMANSETWLTQTWPIVGSNKSSCRRWWNALPLRFQTSKTWLEVTGALTGLLLSR